ncbi:hypothetical protein B0H10DRAFT_204067 [Mycena sp. CBHHK59/15]|nr:hypothetical protein B0H10DRAFT_204067 [Mycena sp. CBHHK59/15]
MNPVCEGQTKMKVTIAAVSSLLSVLITASAFPVTERQTTTYTVHYFSQPNFVGTSVSTGLVKGTCLHVPKINGGFIGSLHVDELSGELSCIIFEVAGCPGAGPGREISAEAADLTDPVYNTTSLVCYNADN